MEILSKLLIGIIKIYKYLLSPLLFSSCRYLPTCSEYFIDCIKINGPFKGTYLGIKRILRCHPIKFLGGKSGYDPAIKIKKEIK